MRTGGLVDVTGPHGLRQVDHARGDGRRGQPREAAPHPHGQEGQFEFVHRHKKCVVTQREIGTDAPSFAKSHSGRHCDRIQTRSFSARCAIWRRSPPRSPRPRPATSSSPRSTPQSAPSTIDRVIDVFPHAQQEQVRMQLANTLQGIVTQTLLPTSDRGGPRRLPSRSCCRDDAVRNLIRQGKVEQIYSVMQTSTQRGMQTMEHGLAELIRRRTAHRSRPR